LTLWRLVSPRCLCVCVCVCYLSRPSASVSEREKCQPSTLW
jgi:hypothetical protein